MKNLALTLLALLPYFFIAKIDAIAHTPRFYPNTLLWDIPYKLNQYWLPYFVIFPAAAVLALIYQRFPRVSSWVLISALLVLPWYGSIWTGYYDQYPHAIVQQWQWSWQFAREGYWAGSQDRRWMLAANGFKTVATLQQAIEDGKITPQTHLLHLTDSDSMWTLFPVSVYTGIDDDVIDFTYDPTNLFEQGGRIRGPSTLPLSQYQYIYDQRNGTLRGG